MLRVRATRRPATSPRRTYLVADVGERLLDADLVGNDLFALIEESIGHPLGWAEGVRARVDADPDTAALLEIAPGAAVFAIERRTRLPDGRPVDVESIHLRADRLTLRATLHRWPPTAPS
jgi:GntR family transcriptional regulator